MNIKLKFVLFLMLAAGLVGSSATAVNAAVKNGSRIIYHDGPVMPGGSNVYFIWYGCWSCGTAGSDSETKNILTEFVVNLGASPYFRINATYPDALGNAPSGALYYGGEMPEGSYSEGLELNEEAIERIIERVLDRGYLPVDANGIYVVFGSADVGSTATGFCTPLAAPHHGNFSLFGSPIKYAFIGNAARCPEIAAPQFFSRGGRQLPTPNANFAADAMASTLAQALNATVTNPLFSGWYDRDGLDNADKCAGKFGSLYTTASGARANIQLVNRDFLIQQNWINVGRGYCGLEYL